jgi:hypothetical protein
LRRESETLVKIGERASAFWVSQASHREVWMKRTCVAWETGALAFVFNGGMKRD